jgi:hypothetical protein
MVEPALDSQTRDLAIGVTRASSNNLFQVATLVRAATALDLSVQVLFRGASVGKLTRDRVNVEEWSHIYAPVLEGLMERLRAADFADMETFLRDAKEHGDHVHYWVSREVIEAEGITLDKLIGSVDGSLRERVFDQVAAAAGISLTF